MDINKDDVVNAVTVAVTVASILANVLPNDSDNKTLALIIKIVRFVAFNIDVKGFK